MKRELLILEQNAQTRRVLRDASPKSCTVVEAESCAEAVAYLRSQHNLLAVYGSFAAMQEDPGQFAALKLLLSTFTSVPLLLICENREALEQAEAAGLAPVGVLFSPLKVRLIRGRMARMVSFLLRESDWDELTGLMSAKRFYEDAAQQLSSRQTQPWVIGCVNISQFKLFNDLYDVKKGDELLTRLAAALSRELVCCGRLESDRFVFCCPKAELSTEKLLNTLHRACDGVASGATPSIQLGLYEVADRTLSVARMCDRAILALNSISASSRRQLAWFDEEMRQKLLFEQELLNDAESALAQGQFELYLQPIYSMTTGKPVSAEALVRWNHPQKGMISPGVFIPLFERNGEITHLDEFVWEQTFHCLSQINKTAAKGFSISANVSRVDVYSSDVLSTLLRLSRTYEVPPSQFHIEITESAYMENEQLFGEKIKAFRDCGFSIVIDDFGSGYSSLNTLVDIPADMLKLDMSFARSMIKSERSACVVESVVRMAKWLEIPVVAEGVETEEQLAFLRSIGCDRVQGYYYSRPLPMQKAWEHLMTFRPDTPISEPPESLNLHELWETILQTDAKLGRLAQGLTIVEAFGDKIEFLFVNDAYYRTAKISPNTITETHKNAFAWLDSENRRRLMQALGAARESGTPRQTLLQRSLPNGSQLNLFVQAAYLGSKHGRELYAASIYDVSELSEPSAAQIETAKPVRQESKASPSLLVVDDNQVNRAVLKKLLSGQYTVLEAENGEAALTALQDRPEIQAILLDLVMPVMDGQTFLRLKRADLHCRGIPVLVLSVENDEGVKERLFQLGVSAFLRKPYNPIAIKKELEKIIEKIRRKQDEKESVKPNPVPMPDPDPTPRNGTGGGRSSGAAEL